MKPRQLPTDHMTETLISDHAYADLMTVDKFGNICRLVDLEHKPYALPINIEIYLFTLSHKLGVLKYTESNGSVVISKQLRTCNTQKKYMALCLGVAFIQRHILKQI